MVSSRRLISATGHTTIANSSLITSTVTSRISQIGQVQDAFLKLNNSIIERGITYVNNDIAHRAGFLAENWHAETYNLDAVIQKSPTRAYAEGSTARASADVSFDGNKAASMKYYKDASSSANAQSKPEYGEQYRVVPSDQVNDAQTHLRKSAYRNRLVGRDEAAQHKENVASKLVDRISDGDGVASTPLSKEQAHDLAQAIKNDEHGTIAVKQHELNEVYEDTGVSQKVKKAIVNEKIAGIGIATAIGLATGFTIGFIITLAQSGINPNTIKYALISGTKASLEGGAISLVSSTLGITLGSAASQPLTTSILAGLGENVGKEAMRKIADMCNWGVVGAITITALSVYEFVKLKHMGFSTKEALIRTGKSAAISIAILVLSTIAQGIWGGPAGAVVSIVSGVVLTGATIITIVHDKRLIEQITLHTIRLSQPNFA